MRPVFLQQVWRRPSPSPAGRLRPKARARGILSLGTGDAVVDEKLEHRITTIDGATVGTSGARAHGITISDLGDGTSETALALGREIKVTGRNAVGVLIEDKVGGVSKFVVTGKIEASGTATTAIQNRGNLALRMGITGSADIIGDILMGTGNDVAVSDVTSMTFRSLKTTR